MNRPPACLQVTGAMGNKELTWSGLYRIFECRDAIKIRNGIIFDCYTGLPHVQYGGPYRGGC